MTNLSYEFDRRPSVAAFMARACWPGILRAPLPFPAVTARWRAMPHDPARLEHFIAATGIERGPFLPLTYLHVVTFPLQMVILTAPALPLPIWGTLQIRNRLLQHRPVPVGAPLDVAATVSGQRVVAKGVELDLHVTADDGAGVAWEALSTCYYRGRFGGPGPPAPSASAPSAPADEVAAWKTPTGGGWRFGHATGDYNGVHTVGLYARLFGFRGAFFHPHAIVGQCLARLGTPSSPARRLDLWFRGPVHYGSAVRLSAASRNEGLDFALREEGDARPAVLGRLAEARPGVSLLERSTRA